MTAVTHAHARSHAPKAPSPWLLMLPLGLAIALLPPALTGQLVVGLAAGAMVLARPRWALYFLAVTVPYQSLADFKFFGASVSITEGVVALLLIGWLTHVAGTRAAGRPARSPWITPITPAVGVLLLALLLSVFVAEDLSRSAKELLKWMELAAVYVAGRSLLDTPGSRRVLLVWLIVAAVSQALVGLGQAVLQIGPSHFMIGGVLMRAYGTFEQPNPFGGYLGLTLPLIAALVLFGLRPGWWRRLASAALALLVTAVVLTLSRGAWAGQTVALLLVLMAGSRAARHALLALGAFAAILAIAAWPLLPAEFTVRFTSVVTSLAEFGTLHEAIVTPENWAVYERLSQWYAGWQMFRDNWLLGVGIGNYNSAYDAYRLDQWPVALGHAHNHYLTIAAEAGLLGLSAYLGFLATVFRVGMHSLRRAQDRLGRAAAIGILGSLTGFATHNMFDVLFVHGMGVTVGLLLALLESVPRRLEDRE